VDAMLLSHADRDHIGGAVTLLLNTEVRVGCVYINPDPTKDTEVFKQLCFALCDAENRSGTRLEPSLTTNTKISRKGVQIEVLFPPATTAIRGVSGRDLSGKPITSNSLSAAIRATGAAGVSILLGGDIETDCLDEWKSKAVVPSARALVFPHHGGLPGNNADEIEAALFADELTKLVMPDVVVFSIHREKFGLPRDEIIAAISKVSKKVRFVCTQLPDRFHSVVAKNDAWSIHRHASGKGHSEGTVEFKFLDDKLEVRFRDTD